MLSIEEKSGRYLGRGLPDTQLLEVPVAQGNVTVLTLKQACIVSL